MRIQEPYSRAGNGVFVPDAPVAHREEEYDPAGFDFLRDMQSRHFWYRGRHRFLLHAMKQALGRNRSGLKGIDLGGGCGGWIEYLKARCPGVFDELALGDSSLRALGLAGEVVGSDVGKYQIDILCLHWRQRWDVAFLLDVLEHIPQDADALCQIREALRPGGLVFVTTPALNSFRTYNDDLARHVRRYSRGDFHRLAKQCGLEVCCTRYFMFFLSPLLLLSRMRSPDVKSMTEQEIREHLHRTHQVPCTPLNEVLSGIFSLETPLGHWLPFPWGTSVLAVLRRK
jgi:SAM-dependent methyltransferase